MNKRRNVYHRKDEGTNIKTKLPSPIIYYPTDEELKALELLVKNVFK